MAKTCTKPKVEVAENKALFSAWGMDDDESDLCEDFKGTCLMAHEETLPQVSSSPDFIKRLHVLGKDEIINMIKELLEDSEVLEKEATEHANEIGELRSENLDLSNRLAHKEQDLLKFKGMALKTKSCEGSKSKKTQGAMTSEFQANTETHLAYIL